jgi:outer membrane autotransporter protein
MSATVAGGYADYDTQRYNDLAGAGSLVLSNPRMTMAASHLRLGHAFDFGSWYLRPMIDTGVNYVETSAFSEHGGGGGTLDVESGGGTVWTLQPEIELGAAHDFASGGALRSYIRVGLLHWLSGTTPEVTASFHGAPAGTDSFVVSGRTDRDFGSVTVGISLLREKNFELRLDYSGRFSDNTSYQGAGLKFASRF